MSPVGRGRGRPRGSVRLRLALLSSLLFLGLGTLVIGAIYVAGRPRPTVSVVVSRTPSPTGQLTIKPLPNAAQAQVHGDDNRLLVVSWVALLITAIASIPLGWFASGRMLRPLREITDRAQTISAGNLHERLALDGPPDEFTKLGATLDGLLERLESSFDAQRRFVANASHELRTPLTVERTLLQVALADPDATAATLRATCEELLAAGYDQERLLEALLTLASSERGLEHREPVDIEALAAGVLSVPRPEIESLRLTVTTDLQGAFTVGDPALIERLISNLVDNAVRHNLPDGEVRITTATSDGGAVVSVQNSGPMVWEDEIAYIFEPFRRLGAPRTGSDSGQHGLGLSIVRAIARAHDATITARPRPGGGLVMTVTFAASAPDQV